MKKVVFLDRDGVINREIGNYVFSKKDFVLNEEIIPALQILHRDNFLLIIISNQGGISKGIYSISDVDELHKELVAILKRKHIEITEIYYCPHHTNETKCLCRKPDSLMIERAIARFNIDVKQSFFIGDSVRDMEASKKAGIKGIKIEPNSSLLPICKKIINREV